MQYKCSKCNKFGKTKASIGGKAAHEKITCPAPNCSVQYHKCSPPSNHAVCDGCGKRKCEDGDHSYVGVCTSEYVHYTKWVAGCGEDIYRCTRSQHQAQTYSCGHTMKACQYASHTCVTDDTPNCSGCTTHCSSPCSCSTSGTCDGTVVDDTPNCSDCTSHCSSPCSCSTSGTCDGTVTTPPPPPSPKPKLKTCSACNAEYDPKSSAAAQHTRQTFPCGVHSGWACSNPHIVEHSTPKTCKRCGTTFYSCNRKGPCVTRRYGTHENHSAAR